MEELNSRVEIKQKLRENFDGKIVRKDLTKKIKEGANVPVYVLEFLLGQYCSSDDEEIIEKGVGTVLVGKSLNLDLSILQMIMVLLLTILQNL